MSEPQPFSVTTSVGSPGTAPTLLSKAMADRDLDLAKTVFVNRPTVVSEVFDGEGVIVHLGTGLYFSLDDRGTALWSRIADDATIGDLHHLLVDEFAMTPDDAARAVAQLVAELCDEDLITVEGGLRPLSDSPTDPIELRRFSDLQDVLLVDPIHDLDLDGDGWPIDAGSGVGRPRGS